MKIATLAVQGAFAEHAKRVQELGAEPIDCGRNPIYCKVMTV